MNPKISVIIPSFNKVKYIGETLDSIFDQNYANLEVIIEDGNSDDGTLEIIKEYAKKYPQISWESKKDKGQLDAVRKGLSKATGKLITFINADDIFDNETFKLISTAYEENPAALWFAGKGRVINSKGREIAKPVTAYKNYLLLKNTHELLLVTNYLMQPSVFFTNTAYKKYGPFTGTTDFITEYDFWLKLASVSMPVVLNKYLSSFRIEASTITKNNFNKLLAEDERIVRKYTDNVLIMTLHEMHNSGRKILGKFL